MKEKIILFPGFSQSKDLYGDYEYADIWEEKLRKYNVGSKEYILGHSMGSLAALIHWQVNKNATIILFNPLLPKRNRLDLLFRFFKMLITSPGTVRAIKGSTNIKHIPIALQNAFSLTEIDAVTTLKDIPHDKLIIIKGEGDDYFFDTESMTKAKALGLNALEIKGVGHYWTKEVDDLIKNLVNKKQPL